MGTNSNSGFDHGAVPSSVFNRHVITFQSGGAINSSGVVLPTGSSRAGMFLSGNPVGTSAAGGFLLDSGPVCKHDAGLGADWSIEEQSILEEGLVKYADEPNIMRYIKIAAALREKTVRDVALRCRWMTKDNAKRRKSGVHYLVKKMKDRKEKPVDSPMMSNILPSPQPNMAAYSFMVHHMKHGDQLSYEASAIGSRIRRLLDENTRLFSQIAANLSAFKIQDNIDLFYCARNNITAILNDMANAPGIMSQMPPLPVSVNEELANSILTSTLQMLMFGAPGGIHLKQEPRC